MALPAALRGPPPYPLPAWATRPPTGEVVVLAMGAGSSLALAWMGVSPWSQLGPLAILALGAGLLRWRGRTRDVLRTGTPLAFRLERLRLVGEPGVAIEYSGPEGVGHATCGVEAIDLRRWPQAGDTVVLVAGRKGFPRRVVWGFVPAPGRGPGAAPWIYRSVSRVAAAIAIATVLLLFGWLAWLS